MAQREIDKKTEQRNYDNTMREIQRLENVVEQQRRWGREKNIKTAEMLKVSMKNKYSNNPKLNNILKKLEELEEELNKKHERLNYHNYSKAKMKSKKL